MGQVGRLADITARLSELDRNDTIYASEPWTAASDAIVATEPDTGGLPAEAVKRGMSYFLEVSIAGDFIEDWTTSLGQEPEPDAICQRLIDYTINDA